MNTPTIIICNHGKLRRFIQQVILPLAVNYTDSMLFTNHTLTFNKEDLNYSIKLNADTLIAFEIDHLTDDYADMAQATITVTVDFMEYIEGEHEKTFRTFISNQLK